MQTLQRFGEEVCDHFLCGTVFSQFIGNKEVSNIDMFVASLSSGASSIILEKHSALAILHKNILVCIPSLYDSKWMIPY